MGSLSSESAGRNVGLGAMIQPRRYAPTSRPKMILHRRRSRPTKGRTHQKMMTTDLGTCVIDSLFSFHSSKPP